MSNKTAENTARDKGNDRAYVAFDNKKHVLGRVLGDRWVILNPKGEINTIREYKRDAWIAAFMPGARAPEDMEKLGYRAVKVKLVEVESDER